MALTLTFDSTLCRVRVNADALLALTASVVIERSPDQISWTTVRGGEYMPATTTAALDDYEFAAGKVNYYRVTCYDEWGDVLAPAPAFSGSITPVIDGVWLKSVARPFLNRTVEVLDFSDISRPSRGGVFDVVGRSFPVAVTDVRGSRRWSLQLYTRDETAAADLGLALASGDILFLQVPPTGHLAAVPAGYISVGDATETIIPTGGELFRVFSLDCVEVAEPGPDVVGATLNWQTVLSTYPTWEALLAAHPTWADLLELIGSPTDVIVA